MSDGLKVGSLYASLTASTGGWSKALDGALRSAEQFSRQMKRISAEVSQAGMAMSAVGAAALHLASSVDGPTKQAMDGLHKSTQLLAVQVADMLLPAVKSLSEGLKTAASYVAGLDPAVKDAVSTFATWGLGLAVVGKTLSVVAGLAGNVFGVLRAGIAAIASVGVGPILAIVASIGLAIGAVLLLHRAWRKNWGGIQETTGSVLEWFHDAFGQLGRFFQSFWDSAIDQISKWVDMLLGTLDLVNSLMGKNVFNVAGAREGFAGLFKDLKSGAFFTEAVSFGKAVGEQIVEGVSEEWSAIKDEFGLDKLIKKGATIELGRGMPNKESHPGSVDTSPEPTRSWFEAMNAQAELAKDSMTKIEVAFDASISAAMTTEQATLAAKARADELAEFAANFARQMKVAGKIFLNGLGALGQTISNIASAASQGGPWAALVAAVMEVLQRMDGFRQMLETLEYGLKRLGQFMEPLLGEIFGVVETLTVVGTEGLKPLFDALTPLFQGLSKIASRLVPIVASVGALFEAVGPVIEVVATIVGKVLEAISPILDVITGVVKVVATALLGLVIAANEIAAALGDEKAKTESARLKQVVDRLWAPAANDMAIAEGEAARAAWRNASAQEDAADAAQHAAESLSNVPSGYKLALARFNADQGITGMLPGGGSAAAATAGGTTINGDVYVTSTPETLEQLADDARREAARDRGQQRGNPTRARAARGDI